MTDELERLPPPLFWRTRCFALSVMGRPDRRRIDPLDIRRVLSQPTKRLRQPDGRYRLWGWVPDLNGWLRVVTLEDGETVHNAFLDRDFEP